MVFVALVVDAGWEIAVSELINAIVEVVVGGPAAPEEATEKCRVRTCPHSSSTATVYTPGTNDVYGTGSPQDPMIGTLIACSCESLVRFQ